MADKLLFDNGAFQVYEPSSGETLEFGFGDEYTFCEHQLASLIGFLIGRGIDLRHSKVPPVSGNPSGNILDPREG